MRISPLTRVLAPILFGQWQEGSKCVNPRKGGATPPAVAAVPHIHGRARDALHAAGTALRVELNAQRPGVAAAAQPAKAASGVALNSGAVDASSSALLTALAGVTAASSARRAACAGDASSDAACEALVGGAARLAGALVQCAAQPGAAAPSLALAHALCAALPSLCDSLNAEIRAAAAKLEPAPAAAEAPSADAAGAKKGAGRPALVLGKGTAVLRAFAERQGVLGVDDDQTVVLQGDIRAVVEANAARRKPKIPKGTRDFLPEQMAIRERAFASIVGVFKRHGAVPLDTPVFELRETLTGKYGEDSKLIYDLADQGGELLSLRYDLTVPFARYLAMHSVGNIKRYHIARVYRRDNPQAARGRYREFYQCDFDIAGTYPTMMPDAEVLKVMTELLSGVDIGPFAIKLNHRKLLDAALECSGVPASKFRTICSAVDKLDKEPWTEVRREMVEDKGLSEQQADAVGTFVQLRTEVGQPRELLARLTGPDSPFGGHAGAAAALGEMGTLFDYLEAMDCLQFFSFDMSLARGLDYYTGAIYEAVLVDSGVNVGSIGGGGRYDNLVGMFSGKVIPAVGVSVGIERIFAILEERTRAKSGGVIRATDTQVLVATIGPGLAPRRMAVASSLWRAGVKAEFLFAAAPNMQKQLTHALEGGIPLVVIFGEDEINAGQVKIKRLADSLEMTVPQAELVERIRELLQPGAGEGEGETHVVVS